MPGGERKPQVGRNKNSIGGRTKAFSSAGELGGGASAAIGKKKEPLNKQRERIIEKASEARKGDEKKGPFARKEASFPKERCIRRGKYPTAGRNAREKKEKKKIIHGSEKTIQDSVKEEVT